MEHALEEIAGCALLSDVRRQSNSDADLGILLDGLDQLRAGHLAVMVTVAGVKDLFGSSFAVCVDPLGPEVRSLLFRRGLSLVFVPDVSILKPRHWLNCVRQAHTEGDMPDRMRA